MNKSKKVTGKYIPSSSIQKTEPATSASNILERLGFKLLPKNLKNSLITLYRSGNPIVTPVEWERRSSICRTCNFWEEYSHGSIARCTKCGCSSGKLLLQTSKCPHDPPKW